MTDDKIDKDLELSGHSYDGITELDNPLPGWWLWTFFFTIIFAFIYFIHYASGSGPTLKQELAAAMLAIETNRLHEPKLLESEDLLAAAMKGPNSISNGEQIYIARCVVCHGANLQGQVGPNLTDNYWIHGKGSRQDIVKVIREGVLDKGMPEWDQMLSTEEIYSVTAYVISKKGSNPANAKAAQGNLIE